MWRLSQNNVVAIKCMLIQHRSTSSSRLRFSSSSWIVGGLRNESSLRHQQYDHTAVATTTATNRIMYKHLPATIHHTAYDDGGSKRYMSEISRGQDLLADSLSYGSRRKIVLESYAPSGVDVKGFIQVGTSPEEGQLQGEARIVHMAGSIIAFPDTCFLWNVNNNNNSSDITLQSLSIVQLYSPSIEYLFIGCESPIPHNTLITIKRELRKRDIIVEQMDIMNAMGTFNILNGEDRRVACALVI